MSFHYLQGQEEFCLDTYLDGLRSARSRLSGTPAKSCSPDSETATCQPSLFGTTSATSTPSPGADSSTLSREGSPAPTSQARTLKVKDLPERVRACGLRCSELLKSVNLNLCSRKTVRTFVPVASAPSSKDLPGWGMTFDGVCWELGTRVSIIEETGCGSTLATPTAAANQLYPYMMRWPGGRAWWPTPVAKDDGKSPEAHMRMKQNLKGGPRKKITSLAVMVRALDAGTHQESWPAGAEPQSDTQSGGPLNPAFPELLMGWALGWTDLKPLAMAKYLRWLRLHGRS